MGRCIRRVVRRVMRCLELLGEILQVVLNGVRDGIERALSPGNNCSIVACNYGTVAEHQTDRCAVRAGCSRLQLLLVVDGMMAGFVSFEAGDVAETERNMRRQTSSPDR